jgi:hypothetical protein
MGPPGGIPAAKVALRGGVGVYDAQAVGADEADVVLAGNLDQFQFPLQPLAGRPPGTRR